MRSLWLFLFLIPLISACGQGFEALSTLSQSASNSGTGVPNPVDPAPVLVKGGTAVDLATPVNQQFLNRMKELNVSTIIRYYDHVNETLPGKTLRRAERDLIVQNGLKIAVVFQHNNNRLTSFTRTRGNSDALRALELAQENLQPLGSAIYFGVDGGWGLQGSELNQIRQYLIAASLVVREAGYRMGVYGSGLICQTATSENLADLCWLANARGWPNYQEYLASQEWVMVQSLPESVGTFEVDFNKINDEVSDFGQFPLTP